MCTAIFPHKTMPTVWHGFFLHPSSMSHTLSTSHCPFSPNLTTPLIISPSLPTSHCPFSPTLTTSLIYISYPLLAFTLFSFSFIYQLTLLNSLRVEEMQSTVDFPSQITLPPVLNGTVSRVFWPFFFLKGFDLGPIWTGKNGFANSFVFAKIFVKNVC